MKTASILIVCALIVALTWAVPFQKPIVSLRPSSTYNLSHSDDHPSQVGRTWINCSNLIESAGFVFNFAYTPSPIQKGQPIKYDFSFLLMSELTGGKTHLTVTWNDIVFIDLTVDLCNEIPCPIPSGAHDATITWPMIPSDAPKGSYTAKFDVKNQDGMDLGCIGQSWNFES